jgi:hypothetical protein
MRPRLTHIIQKFIPVFLVPDLDDDRSHKKTYSEDNTEDHNHEQKIP